MPALRIIALALGYLHASVITLPCLILGVVFYGAHSWRWRNGCLEAIGGRRIDGTTKIWGRPGGQALGWVIYYATEADRGDLELAAHERVHTVQGMIGGLGFAIAYGGHFLWNYALPPAEPDWEPRWRRAYLAIWAEEQARAIARLVVRGQRPWPWAALVP